MIGLEDVKILVFLKQRMDCTLWHILHGTEKFRGLALLRPGISNIGKNTVQLLLKLIMVNLKIWHVNQVQC